MGRLTAGLGGSLASRLVLAAMLAGGVFVFGAPPTAACWEEHPRAERAFRDGIEAFHRQDFELAIERFREARDARRDPDGSCTIQLYGRGSESKAYYLPYYYLGRAFYEGREQLGEAEFSCQDAVHYFGLSLERRGETYDVYSRRFRNHMSIMDDVRRACDDSLLDAAGAESIVWRFGEVSILRGVGW